MTHQLPPNQKDNNPKINVESNYPAGHIGESFNKIEHIINKINQLSSEELTILSKELSSNHNFELSSEQKFIELHGRQLIYHNSLAFYVLIGLGVAFAVPNLIAICLFLVTGNIYAATITTVSGGVSAVFCIRLIERQSHRKDQNIRDFVENLILPNSTLKKRRNKSL